MNDPKELWTWWKTVYKFWEDDPIKYRDVAPHSDPKDRQLTRDRILLGTSGVSSGILKSSGREVRDRVYLKELRSVRSYIRGNVDTSSLPRNTRPWCLVRQGKRVKRRRVCLFQTDYLQHDSTETEEGVPNLRKRDWDSGYRDSPSLSLGSDSQKHDEEGSCSVPRTHTLTHTYTTQWLIPSTPLPVS